MDLSGISVTVDDCLDQDQACILFVVKMFGKRMPALDILMQHHLIFVRLGQFISHLLFNNVFTVVILQWRFGFRHFLRCFSKIFFK